MNLVENVFDGRHEPGGKGPPVRLASVQSEIGVKSAVARV
jgi:hypothetical protein